VTVDPFSHQFVSYPGGKIGEGLCVVRPFSGDSRRHHVFVADGLDLLETQFLDEAIESGEQVVRNRTCQIDKDSNYLLT
jgi:hypothetical protein